MNASSNQSELLTEILNQAVASNASDVHIVPDEPVYFRIDGQLIRQTLDSLTDNMIDDELAVDFTTFLSDDQQNRLASRGSVDCALSIENGSRFRVNVYHRNGQTCFAFRFLSNEIPALEQLGLDERLYDICELTDGLILVAGPTGSGKSTTIASLLDQINRKRACHVITIEDPVEYVHRSNHSLVNQRQIGTDVETFHQALVDAVRQDPDVILVGELRDLDTIRTAITASETGHLVFATVHAGDCKTAIERLVGAFPPEEQNLAQRLVATVLRTVIVQHLLPRLQSPNLGENQSSTRVLASEVMHVNSAISNLIANANLTQITSIIQTASDEGMWTLDDSLARLWRSRLISEQTARSLARDPQILATIKRRNRA